MSDLISREELKKAFAEDCCGCCDTCSHCLTGYKCELIENAHTVPLPDFKEGYKQAILDGNTNFSRSQGDIRWTDKYSVTSSGDIVDFNGQVVGHINLEYIKGGAE